VLGYRQCGERAVRVDILERLADLIRPALAWRETNPGDKPAGAFDGRGFVVTQAMTSLTGSAGEDFASILRALGYRMDRRPPLPPKPVEVAPAETPPVEASTDAAADAPVEPGASAPEAEAATNMLVSGDPAPSAALLPEVGFAPVVTGEETPSFIDTPPEPIAEAAPEPVAEDVPVAEAAPEPVAEDAPAADAPAVEVSAEAPAETAISEAAPTEATSEAAAPEAPAEPQMVEVWRPGGRSDEHRPRQHDRNRDRNRGRHQGKPAEGGAPAAAASGEAAPGEKREQHRRPRRHQDFRVPAREGAPAEVAAAPAVATDGAPAPDARGDRGPRRERFEGKGRDQGRDRDNDRPKKFGGDRKGGDRDRGGRDFGRDKGGRDKGGPSHRPYASSAAPPRERDRPIDPNSPFAKLAALKEQLAGNRKD